MAKKKAPPRTPNPRPRKPRNDGGVRALRKLVEQTRRAHGKMVHQAALAQRQADVLAARLREAEAKLTAALERMGPAPVRTKSPVKTKSPLKKSRGGAGRKPSPVKTSRGGASRKPATRASGAGKAPSPKRPTRGASRKPTTRAAGPSRGPAPKRPTRGTSSSGRPRRGPGRSPRP